MSIAVKFLAKENLDCFVSFAEKIWQRPKDASYYRWRYFDAPGVRTVLVLRDGECVASISAFDKAYMVDGERVPFIESCDWYTLVRGEGLGRVAMRALMELGTPLVGVGGTPDTLRVQPKMGWQVIGTAKKYKANLGLARGVLGRLRALPRWTFAMRARLRHRRRVSGGQSKWVAHPIACVTSRTLRLYEEPAAYRFRPLPDPSFLRWLCCGYPAVGHYIPFHFTCGDRLVAWALGCVRRRRGQFQGRIVEVYAPQPSPELYATVVRTLVRSVAGFGPMVVDATTTCPDLQAALRANGFRETATVPVLAYLAGHKAPSPPMSIGSLYADRAFFRPSDEEWRAAGFGCSQENFSSALA